MLTRYQIRLLKELAKKEGRVEQGLFLVEGDKMVRELLLVKGTYRVQEIYALPEWIATHKNSIPASIRVHEINKNELASISQLQAPNQALATLKIPEENYLELSNNEFHLVLDRVQDPGNLGTIIRLADWFGVQQIICSNDTVDLYNPKVIQSTMGSFARVNVVYTELSSFLKAQPYPLYVTSLEGNNMYMCNLQTPCYMALGNESKGISPVVESLAKEKIKIPSYSTGQGAESLNVAMAGAIVCAEFRRRNHL